MKKRRARTARKTPVAIIGEPTGEGGAPVNFALLVPRGRNRRGVAKFQSGDPHLTSPGDRRASARRSLIKIARAAFVAEQSLAALTRCNYISRNRRGGGIDRRRPACVGPISRRLCGRVFCRANVRALCCEVRKVGAAVSNEPGGKMRRTLAISCFVKVGELL